MFVINNTKLFLSIAGVLILAAIGCVGLLGLNVGIDFSGGTIIEVSYPDERPHVNRVEQAVSSVAEGGVSVRRAGEDGYAIRTAFLEEAEREAVISRLSFNASNVPSQERVSSIGPAIGSELTSKALWAIGIVIVVIILFIALSFRRVRMKRSEEEDDPPRGLSSWYYGLAAIGALIFDTLIPTAVFAIMGVMAGAEVDVLFVTALLAILGYSVNDTIVVFDRIRENLIRNNQEEQEEPFRDVVGRSLMQTYTRSINTSLTTFAVLVMLYTLGGTTTQFFALTLLAGVVAGTYSSIFIASPLLVVIHMWRTNE